MAVPPSVGPTPATPRRLPPALKWIIAIVILLAILFALSRLLSHPKALSPADLYTVKYGTVQQTVSASGTINAPQQLNLSFSQSGTLTDLPAKVGMHVKAGQVLAKVGDTSEQSQVTEAKAGVDVAEAALAKAKLTLQSAQQQLADETNIYQNRSSANETLLAAQNQANQAQSALTVAQAAVKAASIKLQTAEASAETSTEAALQAQVTSDQTTLKNAQANLSTAQAQQSQDETLYGALAADYAKDEAHYQLLLGYENTSAANFYASALQQASTLAQQAQNAKNTLQSDQQTVNSDQAAVESDTASLTSAQQQLASEQAQTPLSVKSAQVALTQAQASESQAQTEYQNAEASLKAAQAVYNDRSSGKMTLDQDNSAVAQAQNGVQSAEASLTSAQAQLTAANAALQNTVLTAPVDGVIVAVNNSLGDLVGSGSTVVQLDSTVHGSLQAKIPVSEAVVSEVHPGEKVSLQVPAYPSQTFTGSVLQVYPAPTVVNNVTDYTVVTSVANTSGKLLPGMTAQATIVTGSKSHVLAVPAVAVHTVGNQEGVYVKAPKHAKTKHAASRGLPPGVYFQPISIGLFGTSTAQVTSGLKSGDEILLALPSRGGGGFGPAGGGVRGGKP